jgi:hypothetical protein
MNRPDITITTTRFRIIAGPDRQEMFNSYGVGSVDFECEEESGGGKSILTCKLANISPESGGGKSWLIEGYYIPTGSTSGKDWKKFGGVYRSAGPTTFDGKTSCGYIDLERS